MKVKKMVAENYPARVGTSIGLGPDARLVERQEALLPSAALAKPNCSKRARGCSLSRQASLPKVSSSNQNQFRAVYDIKAADRFPPELPQMTSNHAQSLVAITTDSPQDQPHRE